MKFVCQEKHKERKDKKLESSVLSDIYTHELSKAQRALYKQRALKIAYEKATPISVDIVIEKICILALRTTTFPDI